MKNFFNKAIKISEEKYYLKVVSQGERTQFSVVLQNAEKIHFDKMYYRKDIGFDL